MEGFKMLNKWDILQLWQVIDLSYDELQTSEKKRALYDDVCEIMDKLSEGLEND
jgi:hypothetical protein